MGAFSRNKGARFEREAAQLFRDAMPGAVVKRAWQAQQQHDNADLEVPRFWPECKVGKLPNPRAALVQAEETCPEDRIAVAVIKDDRQAPFVVLRLEDFLQFVREWWDETEGKKPPPA